MIVNSQNPEFGYEMISVIPYAYYLHTQGLLWSTMSAVGSEPFYYFSPNHIIVDTPRSWYNVEKMTTPNRDIHKPELDLSQFVPPPYKQYYANDRFKFTKPTLCVFNRYNNEWPAHPALDRPINYFTVEFLEDLFYKFSRKYEIVYFNIDREKKLHDNEPALTLYGEKEVLDKYNVITVYDLMSSYGLDYNTVQLKVMANCSLFLTMNGGASILASYFGGKNIIYTNPVQVGDRIYPRENQTGDFNYYHNFGGSEIINLHKFDEILKQF